MSMTIFEEIDQISAEMQAIISRSEQEGRKPNRGERDVLEQLTKEKEMLLGDIIFHGYI